MSAPSEPFGWYVPAVHLARPVDFTCDPAQAQSWRDMGSDVRPFYVAPVEAADVRRAAQNEAFKQAAEVAEYLRHPDYSAESADWIAGTQAAANHILALIDQPAPEAAATKETDNG